MLPFANLCAGTVLAGWESARQRDIGTVRRNKYHTSCDDHIHITAGGADIPRHKVVEKTHAHSYFAS